MFTILSIPDKFKVSKEEWADYINRIIDSTPTEKQKVAYDLINKVINKEDFSNDR